MERLKVSFIEFLNALPLGWGFLHGSCRDVFKLMFDVPSECSRHLAEGEADAGLIPVIEYQRIPGLKVIPGISISTRQEAKSVLFVSRKPIDEVADVAVDISSRTSSALLRILMSDFYRRDEVEYRASAPQVDRMLRQCDAALVIGNPALKLVSDGIPYVYDLAAEWYRFTGLPFVFAFWAVREEVESRSELEIFGRSKQEGLDHFKEIARLYAPRLQIPESEIISYLSRNLDYSLDEKNRRGLDLFFELAFRHRLIRDCKPLAFTASD